LFYAGCYLLVVGGIVAALVVLASPSPHRGTRDAVAVSARTCAPGWSGTTSGRHVFAVENSSNELFDVDIVGADGQSVYGQIETLSPGTVVPLDVILDPGRYYWRCTTSLGSVEKSSAMVVRGPKVAGSTAYLPASHAQIANATAAYRSGIRSGLAVLATDTDALTSAVAGGDRALAEQRWLVAHLDYARLGAAYDTFGNFNDKIDGRPSGLPEGVNDPSFHGFLRLEYGLWHGQPEGELLAVADRLDADVHGLVKAFPTQPTGPTDVPLRSHEILENTLQFELTGQTDEGSHTNLATAAANVIGTENALGAIAPLLEERDPTLLASVQSGLGALETQLDGYRGSNGTWTPLTSLSRTERERLDGAFSTLLEKLDAIPDLLELSPNAGDRT
jgi:high-affinity iron transporter